MLVFRSTIIFTSSPDPLSSFDQTPQTHLPPHRKVTTYTTMVLCDKFAGFEVEVHTVDGRLEEHEDQDRPRSGATISRFLEVKTGQEFSIHVRLLEDFEFKGDCVAVKVSADGTVLASTLLCYQKHADEVHGPEVGGETLQRSRFADVKIGRITTSSTLSGYGIVLTSRSGFRRSEA
jgi:hypothetical protein